MEGFSVPRVFVAVPCKIPRLIPVRLGGGFTISVVM